MAGQQGWWKEVAGLTSSSSKQVKVHLMASYEWHFSRVNQNNRAEHTLTNFMGNAKLQQPRSQRVELPSEGPQQAEGVSWQDLWMPNKANAKILYLMWNNSMPQYMTGTYRLENSFAANVLEVLVNNLLNTSKQGILAVMKANCRVGCIAKSACYWWGAMNTFYVTFLMPQMGTLFLIFSSIVPMRD